jgi:hypothetical protein
MRVCDTCQARRCAGGCVGSTRITCTELAARNRSARFPAAPRARPLLWGVFLSSPAESRRIHVGSDTSPEGAEQALPNSRARAGARCLVRAIDAQDPAAASGVRLTSLSFYPCCAGAQTPQTAMHEAGRRVLRLQDDHSCEDPAGRTSTRTAERAVAYDKSTGGFNVAPAGTCP